MGFDHCFINNEGNAVNITLNGNPELPTILGGSHVFDSISVISELLPQSISIARKAVWYLIRLVDRKYQPLRR